MTWSKGWVEWAGATTINISVPFTWLLPQLASRCLWWQGLGYRVRIGGPAVTLRPDFVPSELAEVGGEVDALMHHNPQATFTSRGCIRSCAFCAVPRIEGDLRELADWTPKPIVCDNNLLAFSREHFDRVINGLKPLKGIDFNQGLDARLLTDYHAERLAELRMSVVRLAWDSVSDESHVMDAVGRLRTAGFFPRKIGVYVLIGFSDTPDDALYRLETLKRLGIRPNVMRYQPLTALRKNDYVAPGWTERELRRYSRYWNRLRWFEHIPFGEYQG